MIHAYLFVTQNRKDREAHGPEFISHMDRLNKEGGYHITVYHNFTSEVNYYRLHHWQCQGRCKKIIKRAMNRAPNVHDPWWSSHQKYCGGNFSKISEPPKKEKSTTRKRKSKNMEGENPSKKQKVLQSQPKSQSIRDFFTPLEDNAKEIQTKHQLLNISCGDEVKRERKVANHNLERCQSKTLVSAKPYVICLSDSESDEVVVLPRTCS
eukprot:TRINITY_DN706_c0_g2_i12.p1 TRINITY_DN706_c0_g2~~TRINITY_DN706_c0_g2_i12.p1  ORF type:complete len:209 (-),score=30.80 TRINITY_DN706_c0_g2_i12:639-1265(-)